MTDTMEAKLFKTKKLAWEYICENYPKNLTDDRAAIDDRSDCEVIDMPNLCWSGEAPAVSVIGDNGEEVERVAWWEEGDERYELYVGKELAGTFDNNYDAREAYDKAVEREEDKAPEDEEVFKVRLFCDGEDIS